ncbi:MAG TPA: GntR family transcriptional regulator [Clostridiales bacterium]|nr:GntR family transcriptional regulator [Clostridiales bacterium]
MSKRENSPTLYAYVKNYIMKLIISGKYPEGSRLPTEFQLMEELQVGRATVCAALEQLEQEGTIYRHQGVGTFVSKRSKLYGLEPFIFLSFTMKHLGLEENNEVLEQKETKVSGKILCERWQEGMEVHQIRRVRKTGNTILAVEDNYYSPLAYSMLGEKDFQKSLSHNLLTYLERPITKIDNTNLVRIPTAEEAALLSIQESEKIIEMIRWMYMEEEEEPVYFAHVLFPSHVLEFPFLG